MGSVIERQQLPFRLSEADVRVRQGLQRGGWRTRLHLQRRSKVHRGLLRDWHAAKADFGTIEPMPCGCGAPTQSRKLTTYRMRISLRRAMSAVRMALHRLSAEIEGALLRGPTKFGREISFSTFRVEGSWRGERSGLQILPAPEDAPRASGADNPFILEFPLQEASLWAITNHRRRREHRRLTSLLNLLLTGTTTSLTERIRP
jgi:hypothetical protein